MKPAIRTTDLDQVMSSRAADRTAGRVTSHGEHWQPNIRETWQETPLPTFPPPPHAKPGDMLEPGQRFGRLVVIGYGGKGLDGGRYVMRCDCGRYGHRRKATLTKGRTLMCDHCDYLEKLKRGNTPSPQERVAMAAANKQQRRERRLARAASNENTLGAVLGPALLKAGANK